MLESFNKVQTRRVHTHCWLRCEKGMCQRSISEKGVVTTAEEGRDVERTTGDGACDDLS